MIKIADRNGYEVWMAYDNTAEVYELFASEDGTDYIGCSDTKQEAKRFAKEWIDEHIANGF